MAEKNLQVVLGASGGIGSALVRELAARGHRVRAVNRKGDADVPEGVERLAADVSTPEGAKAAVRGAAVAFHAAQPAYHRWPQEFEAMNEAVLTGAAAAGAKLVFADNLYMYGPISGPITEQTPEGSTTRKGEVRARMARRLRQAHRSGEVLVTMGRAADYYGPRALDSGAGETLFGAAVRGKVTQWPANADVPHAFSLVTDIARDLVTLGERDEADGEAWLLPTAGAISARHFIQMVFAEAGQPMKLRVVSLPLMRVAGLFIPPARELPDIWNQFAEPFTVDDARFQAVFGPAPATPYAEGIAQTVAWFRQRLAGAR